jgi:hypothetical protein
VGTDAGRPPRSHHRRKRSGVRPPPAFANAQAVRRLPQRNSLSSSTSRGRVLGSRIPSATSRTVSRASALRPAACCCRIR